MHSMCLVRSQKVALDLMKNIAMRRTKIENVQMREFLLLGKSVLTPKISRKQCVRV